MKLIHHAIYFVSCMAIYIGLFWAECQIVPPVLELELPALPELGPERSLLPFYLPSSHPSCLPSSDG